MPKKNSGIWEGLESEFSSIFGEEDLFDTPPSYSYRPDIGSHRQILHILLMIDVSGSMAGTRIEQVNYALENIVKTMRNREDLYSAVKIGIMEFADKAVWVTPRPVPMEDYVFTPIQAQKWFTAYENAFFELEKKLHKAEFMNPDLGEYFAPLILFITDGEPTDEKEYPAALDKLKSNKWFQKSAKYAIAVGEEAKNEQIARLLMQFTGVRENVRYADEGERLCELIEFITVRASEVQTSMESGGPEPSKPKTSIFNKPDSDLWSSIFDDE